MKIVLLCLACLICLATLTSCASERVSRLEFELYRVTSKIERLESKIDMLRRPMSPLADSSEVQVPSREQLENLIVDLKAQVTYLKAQANFESSVKGAAKGKE